MLLILCFWELTSHKLEKVAEWLAALSAGAAQSSLEFGALIDSVCSPKRSSRPQMVSSASQRLHVIVTPHLSILKSTASPPLYYLKVSQQLGADLPEQQCVTADRYTDIQTDRHEAGTRRSRVSLQLRAAVRLRAADLLLQGGQPEQGSHDPAG